jgi:hypothetical protein
MFYLTDTDQPQSKQQQDKNDQEHLKPVRRMIERKQGCPTPTIFVGNFYPKMPVAPK